MLAQCAHQREHDFAHGHGIFTGLDIDVSNGRGTLMNDQVGKFVRREPVAGQGMIVASHRAVMAILTAIIRHFYHTAHKHTATEHRIARHGRPRMEGLLRAIDVVQPIKILPGLTHCR